MSWETVYKTAAILGFLQMSKKICVGYHWGCVMICQLVVVAIRFKLEIG